MKLKYILPVATIASVATIVTPVVTSCAKTISVELNTCRNDGVLSSDFVLTHDNPINIKSGNSYKISADFANYTDKAEFPGDAILVCIGTRDLDPNAEEGFIVDHLKIKTKNVIVNDAKFNYGGEINSKEEFQPKENNYYDVSIDFGKTDSNEYGKFIGLLIFCGHDAVKENTKFSATLKTEESATEQYICAAIM